MQTALFVPCLAQDICPDTALAAADLLERAGFSPEVAPEHTCCGQPLYKTGRFSRAAALARQCMQAFARAESIVSPSASCVAMVRSYPSLFPDDPALKRQAEAMAARTFELCEFLDARKPEAVFAPCAQTVIHHDSCQSRGLGVSDAVRRCLSRVPGLELLELENPAACCGFGGAFSLDYPEISEAILEDKLDAEEELARETGAKLVVTAEISCMCNLQAGLKARNSDIRAVHAAQLMAHGGDSHA